jgi:hypothetical protein
MLKYKIRKINIDLEKKRKYKVKEKKTIEMNKIL